MGNEVTIVMHDDIDNIAEHQYFVRLARIQMRLILSLLFAFLPGVTQVSLMARTEMMVNTRTTIPSIAAQAAQRDPSSSQLEQEEICSSRRRSADAARLLLDDGGAVAAISGGIFQTLSRKNGYARSSPCELRRVLGNRELGTMVLLRHRFRYK